MESPEPQAGGTIQLDRTLLAILEGLQEAEQAGVTELAEETDAITTFATYEGGKGYFTHHFNNKYDLSVINIGSEFHPHQNAAREAMLAALPDAEIETVIERTDLPASTDNTIVVADELFEEIAQIRDQWYAISVAERVEGVQSIAAAVEDSENGKLGAVSISTPAAKSTRSQIEEKYADVVTDTAVEIELKLRYQ